jgi:hypothetical protein
LMKTDLFGVDCAGWSGFSDHHGRSGDAAQGGVVIALPPWTPAPISVVHQPVQTLVFAGPDGHIQGAENQLRARRGGHCPPDCATWDLFRLRGRRTAPAHSFRVGRPWQAARMRSGRVSQGWAVTQG